MCSVSPYGTQTFAEVKIMEEEEDSTEENTEDEDWEDEDE
jgi:hypothetical protein